MSMLAALNSAPRLDFSRATMLVFDQQHNALSIVRDMARGLGFARVRNAASLDQTIELMRHFDYDVLVLSADGQLHEVCQTVRGLRQGDIGANPFAVTILTCARVAEADAAALINSGADAVIFKPFSTEQLYQRLHALVRARKQFVATPQYIGPDRRDNTRVKPGDPPLIEAPNALACSVGDTIVDLGAQIAEARQALVAQQADRLIIEMKAVIDRVCAAASGGTLTAEVCATAAVSLGESVDAVATHIRKGAYAELEALLRPAEQAVAFLAKAGNSDGAAVKELVGRLAGLAQ